MTVFPALRRISAAIKPVFSVYCHGGLASVRGLRTSAVSFNPDPSNPDYVVTREQLKAMLASHSVQLFDIRNRDEFQAGHIAGSVNIPLDQLEESLKLSSKTFEKCFKVKAPKKEDDNIVFHCQRGRRSLTALDIAWRLGFSRARHYAGGYSEWAELEKQ
ncbi:thiosulfate sulfurtransferase/rhodanese-like domain-containing protein 1 [Astyanax mexicanus]|uniref:Thiosulfate sulfurtransferase/rhodanese-like domain-containing protein 1 n=2 Tax=Astyanax mexicanus TaxID=7994 RepID=A0A8B9J577_ASTMX|nr:thiosulfate sulfurtransferase/rhodanese-like domain-containing protein 1 [Astyanax mexicanus]